MSKNLQKALIYGALIATVLMQYEEDEKTKAIDAIISRIGIMMRKTKFTKPKIYAESLAIANKAWASTIEHFSGQNVKFDAVTCVNDFYCQAPEQLQKYANLSVGRIAKYSASGENPVIDSYNISNYMLDIIYKELGEQRLTFGDKLKLYKENK